MAEQSDNYDVVIAGGGPAGAACAIHLATGGARVLLAEQKRFPRAKLCGEFISPECLDHFERLGVAERINLAGGALLSETVFYSERGLYVGVPSAWFGDKREGARRVALGLSRAEMDACLLERAREAGVRVLEETQAVAPVWEKGSVRGVQLKTARGEASAVRSRVAIDATGRGSALVRALASAGAGGVKRRPPQGRAPLVAFKAHLEGAQVEQGHCEIYFYRGGYGGLSSVEKGLSNLCFIARGRDVRGCGSDPERVVREIVCSNARARVTLHDARAHTPWLSVALEGFGRRRLVPARGLIAIGDAASFIDPFTGSGMLMALESGEIAAEAVMRHLRLLRSGTGFEPLARDYRALYRARFDGRLRVSSLLRRAAFVPGFAETAIRMSGASQYLRRVLARATRGARSRDAERARRKSFNSLR